MEAHLGTGLILNPGVSLENKELMLGQRQAEVELLKFNRNNTPYILDGEVESTPLETPVDG